MKFLSLLFLFSISLYTSSAQREFAPPGAVWHYGYFESALGIPLFNGYEELSYDRDTVINNILCKVLTRRRVGEIDYDLKDYDVSEKIIYQDSFKIFSWVNDRFFKIYDFGVAENDTVRLSGGNVYFDSCYAEYRVDSVYYEEIDGENLKNIRLSAINGTFGVYDIINEKFGTIRVPGYLFRAEIACVLDLGKYYTFRCYEDDEFAHYQIDTIACDEYSNTSQVIDLAEAGLEINPNPVKDLFEIKNRSGEAYDLAILDASGRMLYQALEVKNGIKKIDSSLWNSGLFVVQIKIGEQRAIKKLLKLSVE